MGTLALNSFIKPITMQMTHQASTDEVQLQFVTLFLTTLTYNTNLSALHKLPEGNLGMANVEVAKCYIAEDPQCREMATKCYIEEDALPEHIAQKIGFNDEVKTTGLGGEEDTSW